MGVRRGGPQATLGAGQAHWWRETRAMSWLAVPASGGADAPNAEPRPRQAPPSIRCKMVLIAYAGLRVLPELSTPSTSAPSARVGISAATEGL
eukprot:5784251-Pyramimonas_sp.AAC.1